MICVSYSDAPKEPIHLNTSDPESLSASGLSPRQNTKIIIHGYNGSLYYEHTYDIAKGKSVTNATELHYKLHQLFFYSYLFIKYTLKNNIVSTYKL